MEENKPICKCDEKEVYLFHEKFERLDSYIKACKDCPKLSDCKTFDELIETKNYDKCPLPLPIVVQCVVIPDEEDSNLDYWDLIKKGMKQVLLPYNKKD